MDDSESCNASIVSDKYHTIQQFIIFYFFTFLSKTYQKIENIDKLKFLK